MSASADWICCNFTYHVIFGKLHCTCIEERVKKAKYWPNVMEIILIFYASRKGLGDRKVYVCFPKTLILLSLFHAWKIHTKSLMTAHLSSHPWSSDLGKRQGGWLVSEMPNFPLPILLSSPKKAMETSQAVSGSASCLYHTTTFPFPFPSGKLVPWSRPMMWSLYCKTEWESSLHPLELRAFTGSSQDAEERTWALKSDSIGLIYNSATYVAMDTLINMFYPQFSCF